MTEFITNNWEMILLAFMILEKVIKLSPTKADDILLDMVLKPIFNRIKPK